MTLLRGRLKLFEFFSVGCHIFEWWFKPGHVVSFSWIPRHTFTFLCHTNGAVKGRDNCFDFNFGCLGIFFSYTNFEYWRYKNDQGRTRAQGKAH